MWLGSQISHLGDEKWITYIDEESQVPWLAKAVQRSCWSRESAFGGFNFILPVAQASEMAACPFLCSGFMDRPDVGLEKHRNVGDELGKTRAISFLKCSHSVRKYHPNS
jgi:hypothetical protein